MDDINHGVILKPDTPTLYVASGETGIQTVRQIPDQTPYLPDTEAQRDNVQDFLDCVTFSAIHAIETQVNYLIAENQLPVATLQYFNGAGYIQNGKFKCSVRYNAKMNGTTTQGNDAQTVGDHICAKAFLDGLLPDTDWPMTANMNWADYYAEIPQSLIDKAKSIYQYLTIQYQKCSVTASALATAPVQIFTAVCKGWGTDNPVLACTQPCQHATLCYGLDSGSDYKIRDHYDPFNKILAKDYYIYYSQQFVVSPGIPVAPLPEFHHVFSADTVLEAENTGSEVSAWQEILSRENVGFDHSLVCGVFGNRTLASTKALQEKYKDFILVPANLNAPTGIAGHYTLTWANQKYGSN